MPPAAKKDCGLILFDVASLKKQELLNEFIKFATFKYFLNTKSMYRILLVNSDETYNPKKYPGIFLSKIEDLDPKAIVDLIENAGTAEADWLNAVSLGIRFFREVLQMPGLITLQLIYFTTLDSSNISSLNEEKVAQIISQLNENDIYFYLIGPDVQFPFITNNNSVSKCMKKLQIDETNENLVVAKKIVSEVDTAVMCDAKLGIHFLTTFKKFPGTQPWRVPISIGTKLSIPVRTSKIYRKDISLNLHMETRKFFEKTLADNGDMVEESDLIKGIVLHSKFIQIEDGMFKLETERCLDIIGFTNKKFIPEPYICCNETYYILPELNDNDFHIFTHLVNVLEETNKYGVIKRVYANNNNPKYYVLIPNLDHNPKCLTMAGLPFGDALIPHRYSSPVSKTLEEDDEFCAFFKSLIVDDTKLDHRISVNPTMIMDFYQQKLISATAKKYLERDLHFENLDSDVYSLESDTLEAFKKSWPERTLD